jgi:hypothetical protein
MKIAKHPSTTDRKEQAVKRVKNGQSINTVIKKRRGAKSSTVVDGRLDTLIWYIQRLHYKVGVIPALMLLAVLFIATAIGLQGAVFRPSMPLVMFALALVLLFGFASWMAELGVRRSRIQNAVLTAVVLGVPSAFLVGYAIPGSATHWLGAPGHVELKVVATLHGKQCQIWGRYGCAKFCEHGLVEFESDLYGRALRACLAHEAVTASTSIRAAMIDTRTSIFGIVYLQPHLEIQ